MRPLLFQNGAITIGAYPFFFGLALVCAATIWGLLLSQRGYRFRDAIQMWGIVCLLIIFGGRLLYLMIYLPSQQLSLGWFVTQNEGGEILYGSLICGTVGGWYACRRMKLPAREIDAAAVCAPVGIAIGRIGCLCKGCCHGARCNWWCAIRYPKVYDIYGNLIGSVPFLEQVQSHEIQPSDQWSLPVHPVPIYESIVLLCVAAVMFALWRRRILPGRLMFVFGGTYAVWRFTVEFIRVHERLGGLITIYQAISIGVFIACVAVCLLWKPSAQANPADTRSRSQRNVRTRSKIMRKRG